MLATAFALRQLFHNGFQIVRRERVVAFSDNRAQQVTDRRMKRRTKNAKTFHDKCEKFNFRASNETAALTAVFLFIKWDHFG